MAVYVRSLAMTLARTVADGAKWQVSRRVWPRTSLAPRRMRAVLSWSTGLRQCSRRDRYGRGNHDLSRISSRQSLHPWSPRLVTNWDSSADGERFLGLAPNDEREPYRVVLNWQAGL